jgi:hypothetical protein
MPDYERKLAKLGERLPEVASELRALQMIYGWDAFEHAFKAVNLIGEYFNPPKQQRMISRRADEGISAA